MTTASPTLLPILTAMADGAVLVFNGRDNRYTLNGVVANRHAINGGLRRGLLTFDRDLESKTLRLTDAGRAAL